MLISHGMHPSTSGGGSNEGRQADVGQTHTRACAHTHIYTHSTRIHIHAHARTHVERDRGRERNMAGHSERDRQTEIGGDRERENMPAGAAWIRKMAMFVGLPAHTLMQLLLDPQVH